MYVVTNPIHSFFTDSGSKYLILFMYVYNASVWIFQWIGNDYEVAKKAFLSALLMYMM